MNSRLYGQSLKLAAAAISSALAIATLAGCGASGNFTSTGLGSDTEVSGLSGVVHGGPNPVSGATVKLYATATVSSPSSSNAYGYGQPGTLLGSTTTNGSGNFSFSGAETACPAGQQAYIVASGGNAGSGSNSAALLMAAIGPCSGLVEGASGTPVTINEATSIAAAYALSGFMAVNGTTVQISAPANNNAASASCTVVSNATTACAASGLAHAFSNAANLANSTTGAVYAVPPTNATAEVPQALINTLANTVEACINSTGTITGTTAPCAILMTNTGNPAIALNPALTAPTNTLQALLDLAQYPSAANACPSAPCAPGAGTGPPVGSAIASPATAALYNLGFSNAYYAPALTVAPPDFTIAIAYPEAGALWGSAATINDQIYVYDNETPATVFAFSSNGAAEWSTAINTNKGCGSYSIRCSVNADTIGNLWVVDSSGLTQVSTAGVLGTTYTTVDTLESGGVDLGNNVWLAATTIGTANGTQTAPSGLEELPRGASAIVDVSVGGSPVAYACKQPTFDSAGNLWVESDNTGGTGGPGAMLMLSDTGSLTSPAFTNVGSGNGNPVYYPGGDATPGNGVMIDPIGNLWFSAQDDLLSIPSAGAETGGAQNYGSVTIEYGPIYEGGVQRNAAMDGDGKIVIDATSTGNGYLSVYYPNATSDGYFVASSTVGDTGADVYINPCLVATAATICTVNATGESTIVNNPRSTTIDSTGAIWSAFQSAGYVIQVLGPGAPTWSQKSYIPKALAPNLAGNTATLRPY